MSMDSHQRRRLARERGRMGLEPAESKTPRSPKGEPSRTFRWQDAVAIVGVLLVFGFWTDLAVNLRIACIVLCAVLLAVSFTSHKNWPRLVRGATSLVVALIAVFMTVVVLRSRVPPVALVWVNPPPIAANSPLTKLQLNASALSNGIRVEGDYIYEPTFNATLPVGTQTLHVTFIPKDSRFPTREKTVAIAVLEPPVEISPNQIAFRDFVVRGGSNKIPSRFLQQYTFRITNKTDRDVYSIGAELDIKSDHLSVVDFDLRIPRSSWKPLDDTVPLSAQTGDMMAVGVRNKEANRSYFAVAIAHLEPHESREVAVRETHTNRNADTATLTGRIYHLTFDASPTLSSGNAAMLLMSNVPYPEGGGTLEKLIAIPHLH